MSLESQRQQAHYNRIISDYDHHYFDRMSNLYRQRFIYTPLFAGLNFDGKRVADLASGSGFNSQAILKQFPDADVFGIDVSQNACALYEKNVNRPAFCLDLTSKSIPFPDPVDFAIVIGGIHHCVYDLKATFSNIARLIKPGGYLILLEPNAEFALNRVREIWYEKSRYFDQETEEPLVHDTIWAMASKDFEVELIRYMGGINYFFVLNSLLFRTPKWLKTSLYYGLGWSEVVYNYVPFSVCHPYFIARWKRK